MNLLKMIGAFLFGIAVTGSSSLFAQSPMAPTTMEAPTLPGPQPSISGIDYVTGDRSPTPGHLMDLYLPSAAPGVLHPVVIFTQGSAWLLDNGRGNAQALAAALTPAGYVVAGVSIRSSAQVQFPGQLYDIKAAIRWLRAHASTYHIDPDRIGIMGDSSGGWTSAMAAVTGDIPSLDGDLGNPDVSSAVQVAIAFYPPTDFASMDAWALRPCDPAISYIDYRMCHSSAASPESRLLGCPINSCPNRVGAASPMRYISRADPPIMIVHGDSDALVAHEQGEIFYQALNKACHEAVFISMPFAGHGQWYRMITDPAFAAGATVRSTSGKTCETSLPAAIRMNWAVIVGFLDKSLNVRRR